MGTRLHRLAEAVLTSTHNLCYEQKYEKYQNFSSESFHFMVIQFSIYLNRRVFVMSVCTTALFDQSSQDTLWVAKDPKHQAQDAQAELSLRWEHIQSCTSRKHAYIIFPP